MKKRFPSSVCALTIFCLLMPGNGLSATIGVLLKGKSAYWAEMGKGALAAGAASGNNVVLKAPPSEADVSIQIRYFQLMEQDGVQAIVLAAADKTALAASVAHAREKGIKIVTVDAPLAGKAADVFVSIDSQAAGRQAAEQIAQHLPAQCEVSLLRHNQSNAASNERETGSIAALKQEFPGIIVHADIYAGTEKGTEAEKAELLLTKYPKTNGIIASTTTSARAILAVLQVRGLAGKIKLIGYGYNISPDMAKAIETGEMEGWILQMPYDIGAKGVECATKLIKGESIPEIVTTDFLLVTKGNLHDAKVRSYLSSEPF